MNGKHVIALSAGTAFLAFLLGACLCVAIVFAGILANKSESVYHPPEGIKGAIQRIENEMKYGPVNMEAAHEVKNGPLLDRIRANRQSRCQPTQANYGQPQQQAQSYSYTISAPVQSQFARYVDPSDCTSCYMLSNQVASQSITIKPQGIEYPSVKITTTAPPPLNCKDGKCVPRKGDTGEAVKTGAFICSNCRLPKIADWHTEWKEDGTPETFLCKSCYAFMSPQQRKTAFESYRTRQFISAGLSGLLHPEVSN